MRLKTDVLLVLFLVMVASNDAWGDVSPPDSCTAPGQPCTNAGTPPNQPGICTATTCVRSVPAQDGAIGSMSYDCNRCKANSGSGGAGTGGSSGSGGSGGNSAADGAVDGGAADKGSGCSMVGSSAAGAPGSPSGLIAASLFALMGGLAARLTRSHRRRR